jgi:hypothetical protein
MKIVQTEWGKRVRFSISDLDEIKRVTDYHDAMMVKNKANLEAQKLKECKED